MFKHILLATDGSKLSDNAIRQAIEVAKAFRARITAVHVVGNYPYKLMMTPYEKLKSLPKPKQFLKPNITFEHLDAQANAMSDNEAA